MAHILTRSVASVIMGVFVLFSLGHLVRLQLSPKVRYIAFYESNANPKEGDSVHLFCNVVLLDYEDFNEELEEMGIVISIQKDNVSLTRNEDVIDKSFRNRTKVIYTVDVFDSRIGLEVFVSSVLRNDTGVYNCLVYDKNDRDITDGRQKSRIISVRYYPDVTFPRCSSTMQRVYLGSQVTLWCKSEDGNPPGNPGVDLRWRSRNEVMNVSSESSEVEFRQDGVVTSELILTTTYSDINDVFTCEIYSPNFPKTLQMCSITVNVVWPISLSLHPYEITTDPGNDLHFTCSTNNAISNDDVRVWEWNVEPNINNSKVLTSRNVLDISDIQIEDNATSIYCFALFEEQWFQSLPAMIFVNDPDGSVLSTDSTETPGLQTGNKRQAGWIAAFIVVLIVCTALTILSVFLFLKQNKRRDSGHERHMLPHTSAANVTPEDKTGTVESTYTGLQGSCAKEVRDEYTELNTAKSVDVDKDEYAYANDVDDNLIQANDTEDFVYDYAEADRPIESQTDRYELQPTYGNIK